MRSFKEASRFALIFIGIVVSCITLSQVDFVYSTEPPLPGPYYVTIEKTVNTTNVILSEGQSYTLNYNIIVTVSSDMPQEGICYFTLEEGQKIYVNDSEIGNVLQYIEYIDGPGIYEHPYPVVIGPYNCDDYIILENTACLKYNPIPPPEDCCANTVVTVEVQCEPGCTLTPGYWKTHAVCGSAPYDDTWDALDGGNALFFGSGKSYCKILWTPPKGGNAFYILAHQYIAAELNIMKGASTTPAVDEALCQASELLDDYDARCKIPKRSCDRVLAIQLSKLLDDYNNGVIGPGHCCE